MSVTAAFRRTILRVIASYHFSNTRHFLPSGIPLKFITKSALKQHPVWLISLVPALKIAHCATKSTKNPTDAEISKQADSLYDQHNILQLYELLQNFKNSENPELVWRLARANFEMSKSATTNEKRKEFMYEAFELSKKALRLDDKNFACHKWYAIVLDEIGKFEGVKYRLQRSPEVKEHFERAIALNPNDPTSLHCLGYWHYSFADLAWYQRQAAAAFFAAPPKSTYEEAIVSFQQAEKIQPNFYSMNLLMLGKSYMKIGDYKHAVIYLEKLKGYKAETAEDKKAQEEGKNLLNEAAGKV